MDSKLPKPEEVPDYDAVLDGIVELLSSARRATARAVNATITSSYWEIGRRLVEYEQGGAERADYGQQLLPRLAKDLSSRFGRGFSRSNLQSMRLFYLAYPSGPIRQTLSGESSKSFPLPWSHYVRLLSVENPNAREFYESEAIRSGWSVRQLTRQVGTQFYERTALSKEKAAMLERGEERLPADAVSPEEEIKDPFVLEFLDLKDQYSETDLEAALIHRLEDFLLELGGDFAFVGRQRRLRIDNEWYRVDLLFFHRRLRCLVVIDLKLEKLTHADAGQMHMYLNYAREHWTHPDENPPVGLILCATKGEELAKYALEGLPNKVLASEYRTALPDEKMLAAEIKKAKEALEASRLEGPVGERGEDK